MAKSGPVGAEAFGGVAWRFSVEGGSGVDGPVVSVSSVGVGPAGWGVASAMGMIRFREVRGRKKLAVSCGESPRAVCANRY